ncbi:MAG: DMT family transporter [Armatimonadetes bacterium]|nr:DMT family transporter [Armatimonadota bacterium]
MKSGTGKLILLLAGLNIIWGPVNFSVFVARESFSQGLILALRWPLFAISLWTLIIAMGRWGKSIALPKGKDALTAYGIGLLAAGPAHALYTVGLLKSTSTETTILNLTAPLFVGLLAHFILHERVGLWRWVAIWLSIVGAYVVSLGFGIPQIASANTIGDLIYLCGTILESLAMVLAIRVIRKSSGLGTLVFEVTGMATTTLLLPLILPNLYSWHVTSIGTGPIIAIVYLALVAGLICFGTWYLKAENAPITLMVPTLALQGPTSAIVGWYFRHEKLGTNVLVGSILIIGALFLSTFGSRLLGLARGSGREMRIPEGP